jgi:hypothetical protein
MHWRFWVVVGCLSAMVPVSIVVGQESKAADSVSFDRNVKAILRKRCGNCHNPERPRGDLDLTSYASVVAGGASGKAVVAGNAEDSPLYAQVAHLEDPFMPPNAPKIPQREIDTLRRWIETGLREAATDAAAKSANAASASPAAAAPSAASNIVTPAVLPRLSAVTALAVNPAAPMAAASGYHQVLIFDTDTMKLRGALPFAEGDVFALKFSRDGRYLMAAGGLGAEAGKAVVFETREWARVASLGDEVDIVLAADLSPDAAHVALGGPSRALKILGNPGGQSLHTFRKPTDWVTAAAFSPDGLLVAAGDRFGALFLWETRTGREFLTLRGHAKSLTSITWDAKNDRLITAGEDGAIQCWNLHEGTIAARWEAHAGGVLSVDVDATGLIASAGRDRRIKVWDAQGKVVNDLGPTDEDATRVVWTGDGKSVLTGDLSGQIRLWRLADSSSTALPLPSQAKAASALALVPPILAPMRAIVVKHDAPSAQPQAPRTRARGSYTADFDTALAAAKEAKAAAERSLATVSRLAESRGSIPQVPATGGSLTSIGAAIDSATNALAALQSALAADPGNASLARAIEETNRGIKALEKRREDLVRGGMRDDSR